MSILDPEGLFSGERLAALSDRARVYWPWIYTASNSFARLEFNPRNIVNRCFAAWRESPISEQRVSLFIAEYEANALLFVYERNGQKWIQFDTPKKFLPTYQTKRDKMSPTPTPQEIAAFEARLSSWRVKHAPKNEEQQSFLTFQKVSHGIGIGTGIGEGKGKDLILAAEPPKEEPVSQGDVKSKKPADPRHSEFRQELAAYWVSKNSTEMPWDGSDARQLSALLMANPTLTSDRFRRLVLARSLSEVNHSERIRSWIARSTDYGNGPLDTYNKPKSGNGGQKSEQNNRLINSNDNVIGGWLQNAIDGHSEEVSHRELSSGCRTILGSTS